jgi:CheY-like chemotaxis protein
MLRSIYRGMASGSVLVVEDDDTIRRLLMEVLKQHSYLTVEGARDGIEALHLISTNRYVVIILDLLMPGMSGVDFLDSLNALTSDPSAGKIAQPPDVIVITSASENDVPAESVTSRCPLVRDVLRKPLDVLALADAVEAYLKT